jgi:hypothetical protein
VELRTFRCDRRKPFLPLLVSDLMQAPNYQPLVRAPGKASVCVKQASRLCAQVHPLVLFNILDHYIRRNEGQERVIGTLLGVQSSSNSVTITNSFPVPHSEGEQVRVYTSCAVVLEGGRWGGGQGGAGHAEASAVCAAA